MKIKKLFVRKKGYLFDFLILSVVIIGVFSPIVYIMRLPGDFGIHLQLAAEMREAGRILSPHFLYQALLLGIDFLIPSLSFSAIGSVIMVVCYLSTGTILYLFYRKVIGNSKLSQGSTIAVLFTLGTLLLTPITIFTWGNQNYYHGYWYNGNVYHNPTIQLLKPLSIVLFFFILSLFKDSTKPKKNPLVVSTLVVLSAFAKPSFLIIALPVIGITGLLRFLKKKFVNWNLLILGFVIPGIVCLAAQFYIAYLPNDFAAKNSTIIFAPFAVFGLNLIQIFKYLMSILLPIAVTVIYFREVQQDEKFTLSWALFGLAVLYAILFAEEGRINAGNFAWGLQIASFLLFLSTIAFLLKKYLDFLHAPTSLNKLWKLVVCGQVLALHLISGLGWYIMFFNPHAEPYF